MRDASRANDTCVAAELTALLEHSSIAMFAPFESSDSPDTPVAGHARGVTSVVKSLGLLGDWAVDKLHHQTQMSGMWCDGDWRRVLAIDPTGMNAANFTTFSLGIGALVGGGVGGRSMCRVVRLEASGIGEAPQRKCQSHRTRRRRTCERVPLARLVLHGSYPFQQGPQPPPPAMDQRTTLVAPMIVECGAGDPFRPYGP